MKKNGKRNEVVESKKQQKPKRDLLSERGKASSSQECLSSTDRASLFVFGSSLRGGEKGSKIESVKNQ